MFPRDRRSFFLVCFCGQSPRLMDWGSTSLVWLAVVLQDSLSHVVLQCLWMLPLTGRQQCMFLYASSLWRVLVLPLWVWGLWSFDSFSCLHLYICCLGPLYSCWLVLSGAAHVSGFTEALSFMFARCCQGVLFGSILQGSGTIPSSVEGVEFFFGGVRAWSSDSVFVLLLACKDRLVRQVSRPHYHHQASTLKRGPFFALPL